MKQILLLVITIVATALASVAQCQFIPSTSGATDTLSYVFSGGSFESFGCEPIDPTYWLSGNGMEVTVNFVNPESYPGFRVWGMNSDDSASVKVNGLDFPLNASTASYDPKVVCGLSPGPNGVIFSNGLLVGANTPGEGNYSYQDVHLVATDVISITISGVSGAGWGFAGVSVACPQPVGIDDLNSARRTITVYPNPTANRVFFSERVDAQLCNLSGQLIGSKSNSNSLDLSHLPTGIYMLTLMDGNGNVLQRSRLAKE